MDLGLKGARVLVTAASRGLGAATARQFSREGARVVICSRNLEALQSTAAAIVAETGNPVFTFPADLTDTDASKRLIRNAAETLGGLDVVVTNAGGPPAGTFADFDLAAWQAAFQLNILSTVSLIREGLPHLRQSTRAAILTISSMAAKQPVANLTLSNALRPAILGLTKTLSIEVGSEGIRVNSILPGYTSTDRVTDLVQERARRKGTEAEAERAQLAAGSALKRLATPEEFANAAVFLCSPAAGYITGVALPVDGGTILGW